MELKGIFFIKCERLMLSGSNIIIIEYFINHGQLPVTTLLMFLCVLVHAKEI